MGVFNTPDVGVFKPLNMGLHDIKKHLFVVAMHLYLNSNNNDGWVHKGAMSTYDKIDILIPGDRPSMFPSLDKCEILICFRNEEKRLY